MRTVRVKICGITNAEDLRYACEAGADAIGLIVGVPSSPRNLGIEEAKELLSMVPRGVTGVVVAVPEEVRDLLEIHETLNPRVIQIHGEGISNVRLVRERAPGLLLVRAVQVDSIEAIERAMREAKLFDAILVDSHADGRYGGTGFTHDWSISELIRDSIYPKPLILAGGLNPENVCEALSIVKPYAVDVSSGVEVRPGVKDREKVRKFILEAKSCPLPGDYDLNIYGGGELEG